MRGVARGTGSSVEELTAAAQRLGFGHYLARLSCQCGRCRTCETLALELLRDVVFWRGQAKAAITRRDELDKTILSIDGGVGHWRLVSKETATLLNITRNELNAARDPLQYRTASGRKFEEHAERLATIVVAAAEREEDVEQRVNRARDVLYELHKTVGVETPIGQTIREAWATL